MRSDQRNKNKKDRHSSQEKLDKLAKTFLGIKKRLEKYDSYSYAVQSIERMLNWLLAISTGLLIAIFANIDKYKVENKIPSKTYILAGIIFLIFSAITFAFVRFVYYISESSILMAKGNLTKLATR